MKLAFHVVPFNGKGRVWGHATRSLVYDTNCYAAPRSRAIVIAGSSNAASQSKPVTIRALKEPPKNPDAAFLGFCKSWFKKRGRNGW